MTRQRIEDYFLTHPHQRLVLSVILGIVLTFVSLDLVSRSIELSFGTEKVAGVIVRHNTGGKSSSYEYEYKVAGNLHIGKLLTWTPFVFKFQIGEDTQVVFNSRKPGASTLEVAMFQEYVACIGIAAMVIAIWTSCWRFAIQTVIGAKVDSIDLRQKVIEFEEERQRRLKNRVDGKLDISH